MTWERIKSSATRGRGRTKIDYGLMMSRHSSSRLAITIAEPLMRRLKWKLGDRVHFLIDDANEMFGLQRTTSIEGRTLTTSGGPEKSPRRKHGFVKITIPEMSVLIRCVNGAPRRFGIDEVLIDDSEDIVAVDLLPAEEKPF